MTTWNNCTSDVYYSNEAPTLRDPGYEVSITNDEIVVSYKGNTGRVNYRGKDLGGGHYELVAPEVDGQAMLHRYGNSKLLTGSWAEGGWHGMWRIYLEGATEEDTDDVVKLTSMVDEDIEDIEVPKKRPKKTAAPTKSVVTKTPAAYKKAPGSNFIFGGRIKKGMTYQDVLTVVGVGNLYAVKPIFAMAMPRATSVMSYNSRGIPSAHLIGFDVNQVVIETIQIALGSL